MCGNCKLVNCLMSSSLDAFSAAAKARFSRRFCLLTESRLLLLRPDDLELVLEPASVYDCASPLLDDRAEDECCEPSPPSSSSSVPRMLDRSMVICLDIVIK
jgi:hypothetical protein